MGYGVFNAVGQVRDITERTTSGGSKGKVILMKLGVNEWNGQSRETMFECSVWGKNAEQAATLQPGATVSVSGTIECQQSSQGYWNPRLRVREVVALQQPQGYRQQGYQGYQQPMQPTQASVYDQDIPF